jgi:hypothetical protein
LGERAGAAVAARIQFIIELPSKNLKLHDLHSVGLPRPSFHFLRCID